MALIAAKFIGLFCLVVVSGVALSKIGDELCRKGVLPASIMGLVFFAAVTSLPEILASIGAVTVVRAPDMAIGNVTGSIMFNLMIVALLDLKTRTPILAEAKGSHNISASVLIIMLGLLIGGISLNGLTGWDGGILGVGMVSIMLAVIYFVAIRYIWRLEEGLHDVVDPGGAEKQDVFVLWGKFAVAAAVIMFSSLFLAKVGKEMVSVMGWSELFVGTILLAFTTSMPEIVVSIAALAMGSVDMALGNIFGSNLFNILIIPGVDVIFREAPVLSVVSGDHAMTALLSVMLTGFILLGLNKKMGKSPFRIGWETVALLVSFVLGNIFFWQSIY